MRALVVDDSRATRCLLRRTLEQLGFAVDEAENGRVGLERLEQDTAPDLALVDWNMPEMNGLEFLRAVRADAAYADVRIIMATSETDPNKVQIALNAGADDYITKPFTCEVIRRILGVHGLVPV